MDDYKYLNNKDIVCLATQAWDANWTPCQQLMKLLAPENRIVYVEPFRSSLAWLKGRNTFLREQRKLPRLRKIEPNLYVYRMGFPYLPFNTKLPLSRLINGLMYRNELQSLIQRMGMKDPLLWAFTLQCVSVLQLSFEKVIYDCVDEWIEFCGSDSEKEFMIEWDDALCREADIVFAGSRPLLESRKKRNVNTYMVNHGVDAKMFGKAVDPETVVPVDLEAIPHPRVGFVGLVDDVRFDADLVMRLTDNSDHQIVIIGDYAGGLGRLDKLLPARPNLHILGLKPVQELPAYLKGLDVCLMPYRINEVTRNIYPLKLHEYLASGKPVVTTRIAAVEDFEDLLYVADDVEEYAQLVIQAVEEEDSGLSNLRQECAANNSWEHRAEEKDHLLSSFLL